MPNYSTLRKQLESVPNADRHRTEWTEAECLRLIDLADEPGGLARAARQLGRTYYATLTAHSLLQQGWVPNADPRQPRPVIAYSGWTEGMGDGDGRAVV